MAAKKTTRRDFLSGYAAIDAIGDIGASAESLRKPSSSGSRADMLLQLTRRAMACDFQVFLNTHGQHHAAEIAVQALDLIDQLEDQLTIYRGHSEVSQLNESAYDSPVVTEGRLFWLLSRAVELYRATSGAFDITAGPLTRVWKQARQESKLPNEEAITEALAQVGSGGILLDPDDRTVLYTRLGLSIDLGAIGKGYALDRAAELLIDESVSNFLLHGGHSSVLARGQGQEVEGTEKGWVVGLRHPLRTDQRMAEFYLCDEALGTSGAANQFFYHQGKRYGHVLDPRTGWPTEGVLSATVISPDAESADALATACYVLGLEGVQRLHAERPELGIVMITAGARGKNEVHSFGMSQRIWRVVIDAI